MARYQLTKDPKALVKILDEHVNTQDGDFIPRKTMLLLYYLYLNGVRNVTHFNPQNGIVKYDHLDNDGNLVFRHQQMLRKIDELTGRLLSLDARPTVMPTDDSLESLRERASAQVILDAILRDDELGNANREFIHSLLVRGGCGLYADVIDHPSSGLTAQLTAIPPWEIFPFPSITMTSEQVYGLLWRRFVPFSFLKDKYGQKVTRKKDDLELMEVQAGEMVQSAARPDKGLLAPLHTINIEGGKQTMSGDADEETVLIAEIRELWLEGPNGICERYILQCGNVILEDIDYEARKEVVYTPISYARAIDSGKFHGLGICDLLYPLNREIEKMLSRLFQNVANTDRYPIVFLPGGLANISDDFRDTGFGLRLGTYRGDPLGAERLQPVVVQPTNPGPVTGQTVAFASDMMDRIAPKGSIVDDKGRVDSASGLRFLDEQVQDSSRSLILSYTTALGKAYRALAQKAGRMLRGRQDGLPITRLDENLIGIQFNAETNRVSFMENPIPDVSRLKFSIRDASPKSRTALLAGAKENLQLGLHDNLDFIIMCVRENLPVELDLSKYHAIHRKTMRNILLLYGDGKQPSSEFAAANPLTEMPEYQIRVLGAFMMSPEFLMASQEVQDGFLNYYEFLMMQSGQMLPEGYPNPDDLAILDAARQKAAEMEGAAAAGLQSPQQ